MSAGRVFIDTNVLVYAYDRDAGDRRRVARERLEDCWARETGALSTQVLQEFYVSVTRKIPRPLAPAEARGRIVSLKAWHVIEVTADDVLAASELAERHVLSFWDALIVRAASRARSAELLTEDLNDGQVIEGVRIRNPFAGLA